MNALRRILLVIYSVLLLGALGGIGALAWNQDEQLDFSIQDLNFQGFIDAADTEKYILTAILVALGVVALVTLLVALWPQREGKRATLRLRQSDGAVVELTSSSLEALLKDEIEALPEVTSATPRVSLSGGAVATRLDVQIEPSVSIAQVTRLLAATVEETLREQVGVTAVRKPVVRIRYDEMAARPVPARRPRATVDSPELRPQHPAEAPEAERPAPRYASPNDEESAHA